MKFRYFTNDIRSGILLPEPSETPSLVTSKIFTRWTLLVMVEPLLLEVVIAPSVSGTLRLDKTFSLSALKMVSLPLPSLLIPSLSLLDLSIRALGSGMPSLVILLSASKARMDTRTLSTPSLSHQMERISCPGVWIRPSRCGSWLLLEEAIQPMLQRVDDASELSRDTRYVSLVAFYESC